MGKDLYSDFVCQTPMIHSMYCGEMLFYDIQRHKTQQWDSRFREGEIKQRKLKE